MVCFVASYSGDSLCAQGIQSLELEQQEQDAFFAAATEAAQYVVKVECIGGVERVGGELISSAPTSGVVVDPEGYIACSAYAFEKKPTSILVERPDGQRVAAEVVSKDHRFGLVLLKVDVDAPLEVPMPADSSAIQVGQWAITVARTLPGDMFNMSVGILSAKNRVWGKAIQFDANISPSNYGGALAGIDGRILGIVAPRSPNSDEVMSGTEWYDSGISFAIPLDRVVEQLDQWKAGDLYSGKIGIAMESENLYAPPVIGVCRPKSPGRDADLRKGDKITAANGQSVANYAQLKHILGPMLAGEVVNLEVARGGETLRKTLQLVEKLEPYQHAFLGILPGEPAVVEADADGSGVPIRWVYPDSPAASGGLQAGDQILKVNEAIVKDERSLRRSLAELEPEQEIQVIASRDGEDLDPVTLVLDTDTEQVPESIPDRFTEAAVDEDLPPLGKINVKLPEEVNDCTAFIPESYDPRFEHGLLVVLPTPGEKEIADLVRYWRDACNQSRTILLVPQSRDERSWEPSESQFIRKTIENLKREYQIDPDRIALFGEKNSGAMAYLTGFTYRDLIRGVAVFDAGIPRSSPALYNEPLQRLSIWIAGPDEGRTQQRIEANVESLRKLKFPVCQTELETLELNDSLRQAVVRWVDTLDRL